MPKQTSHPDALTQIVSDVRFSQQALKEEKARIAAENALTPDQRHARDVLQAPNPHQHSLRQIADAALISSTENGKLNLDKLATILNDTGRAMATYDTHYTEAVAEGRASVLAKYATDQLNHQVRHVLGITPSGIGDRLRDTMLYLAEGGLHHGLECTLPNKNVDFSNLNNTLRNNHVTCEKPGSRGR